MAIGGRRLAQRSVRSGESATIERIDTLESDDRDCDPSQASARGSQAALPQAFERLRKQEREVAVMLYVNEWTLRDVGDPARASPRAVSPRSTPSSAAVCMNSCRASWLSSARWTDTRGGQPAGPRAISAGPTRLHAMPAQPTVTAPSSRAADSGSWEGRYTVGCCPQ